MLILAALLAAPCNAHPTYAVQPAVSALRVSRAVGGYRASERIAFGLRVVTPALIPSLDPGLLEHVQGHLIVAQRVVRSSNGMVRALGKTRAQALARVRESVAHLTRDLQAELIREESAYDNVTENGTAQTQGPLYGFPGGPDVQSPCVHPGA